jgi:hypothetical protein
MKQLIVQIELVEGGIYLVYAVVKEIFNLYMFIQDIYINHAKPIPCHKKWIRGPQLNLICVCMFARFDYSLFCGCTYITWFLYFSLTICHFWVVIHGMMTF